MHKYKANNSIHRLFLLFLGCYLIAWCILPALLSHSVFLDTAENLALSHTLAWSYSKHPPLGMALLHAIQWLVTSNEWASSIADGLCLSASLFGIYCIAREALDDKTALVATMLSSLSLYFLVNFAIEYNQNTIMLPFWIGIIAFTLRAAKHNRPLDWLFLSMVTVLGILAKYQTLMIIGLALIYLLCHLKKAHIKYLLMTLMLTIIGLLPHLHWLFTHHFNTITYLFHESNRHIKTHHFEALKSLTHLSSQAITFWYTLVGALFVQPFNLIFIALFILGFKCFGQIDRSDKSNTIEKKKPALWRSPVFFFACVPWLSFCLLALVLTVKAEWGFPLFVTTVIAFFYYTNHHVIRLKTITITIIITHFAFFIAYALDISMTQHTHRTNWPSRGLAKAAQTLWSQHESKQPLRYIGGDGFAPYYLTAYLPQHPLMLKDYSLQRSSWIDPADFYHHGAVFVVKGCRDQRNILKEQGFPVTVKQCVSLPQTNKWRHPHTESFTLYLLPPKPLELSP